MKLSVVMPAFNEARFLMRTALEAAAVLERCYGADFELILVDDGSTDDTLEVALTVARLIRGCSVVTYSHNAGKGYAMHRGFDLARGDVVAFLDADGEIRPEALLTIVPRLDVQHPDLVVGRKVMEGRRPWHRHAMRWGVRWIGRLAFGLPVTDPQTGIKAVVRDHISPYVASCKERGYLFDLELLALALRGGARLQEVDVEVRTLRANRIPSSAGLRQLQAVGALWWRFHRAPRPMLAASILGPAAVQQRSAIGLAAHPSHASTLLSPPEKPAP